MEDAKIRYIEREIIKIKPKIPSEDFITNYKDFLKLKNTFIYYSFNSKVLENLIDIAFDLYINNKRFDKTKLFGALKSYYSKKTKKYKLPKDTFNKMFKIFKIAVNKNNLNIIKCANLLISNQQFSESQLNWLLNNTKRSVFVLNRVLRYPYKNKTIFEWAKNNFEEDEVRERRAEQIAIILNYNPNFILQKKVVIEDFEYLLYRDFNEYLLYIKSKNKDEEEPKATNDEIASITYSETKSISNSELENDNEDCIDYKYHYFTFKHERYYERIMNDDGILDIEKTKMKYMKYIDKQVAKTRIWAIYYSLMDKKTKEDKLKKIFYPEVINSMIYVATKMKSVKLLKWLKNELKHIK